MLETDRGLLFELERGGTIVARVAATGSPLWSTRLPLAEAIVSLNGALFAYGRTLTKIDETKGIVYWTRSGPGDFFDEPMASPGRIIVEESSGGAFVTKFTLLLDNATGRTVSVIESKIPGVFLLPLAVIGDELLTYYASGTADLGQLKAGYLAARVQRNDIKTGHFIEADDFVPDFLAHGSDTPPADRILTSKDIIALEVSGVTYIFDAQRPPARQRPLRLSGLGSALAIYANRVLFATGRAMLIVTIDGRFARVQTVVNLKTEIQSYRFTKTSLVVSSSRSLLVYYNAVLQISRQLEAPGCDRLSRAVESAGLVTIQCTTSDGSAEMFSYASSSAA